MMLSLQTSETLTQAQIEAMELISNWLLANVREIATRKEALGWAYFFVTSDGFEVEKSLQSSIRGEGFEIPSVKDLRNSTET